VHQHAVACRHRVAERGRGAVIGFVVAALFAAAGRDDCDRS